VILSGLVFDETTPITGATVTATVSAPVSLSGQTSLGNYQLVGQIVNSDTSLTDYSYSVTLTNTGGAITEVRAELASLPTSVAVLSDTLVFGNVPANSAATSANTITIERDPSQAFDPATLQWNVTMPGAATTVTLANSGPFDAASGDGIYTGTFTPASSGTYTAFLSTTGTSLTSNSFSRTAVTQFQVSQPLASFLGFADVQQSGGLTTTASINVQTAGTYRFTMQLQAGNQNIAQSGLIATLATGSQQVSVTFSNAEMLGLAANGPYERVNALLVLQDTAGDLISDGRTDAGPTAAFALSSFNTAPLYFTGQNTATGVDTNGLTGFDLLRVQVGVSNPAGACQWQASLTDQIGTEIDQVLNLGTLAAGSNTLTFDFSGPKIARNGQNGPYQVTAVDVICYGGGEITSRTLFATQPFTASQFQNTPADFALSGSVTTVSVNTLSQAKVNFSGSPIAGFSQVVNLSVAGLPNGATGTFVWPQFLVPGTSILQINPGSNVPAGTYPLTITATGGGLTRNAPLSLTVIGSTTTTAANVTAPFSPSNQTVTLSATVTSGSGTVNVGTVSFVTPFGQVTSGTVTGGAASTSFTVPGGESAHVYSIQAAYNPGPGFAFSSDLLHTLTVTLATPTITWSNPADIVVGTALSGAQLNATASTAGAFVYNPVAGTLLGVANAQTLSVLFTPTDTTDYNNASKNVSINVTAPPVPLNQRVLVVYNTNFSDSLTVANYYMTQRGIPAGHLCAISPPSGVELSITDYLNTVKTPVQTCLTNAGNTNILYIVFSYLTPYRILASGPSAFNYSLDSYASDIWDKYTTQTFNPIPTAAHRYYAASQSQGNVFLPFVSLATYRTQPRATLLYSVWRLDGATLALAKGLVDKAIQAENAGGPAGQACFDERLGGVNLLPDAGFGSGDWTIHAAAGFMSQAGIGVMEDTNAAEFGAAPAPLTCPNAAFYSGWYSLDNYNDAFTWNSGAIGFHLDGASAVDTRSGPSWSANAILRGITIASGSVGEPEVSYLDGLPRPGGLYRNLLEGANVGDAFLRNTQWIKWMILNIGDPLYRPFVGGRAPINQGLAVNSLGLNPQQVVGGAPFTGNSTATITLSAPAPSGGASFNLTSDQPAAASVPASVTVAAGSTTATFAVTTAAVAAAASVKITASGSVTLNNTLQVNPLLGGISLSQSTVTGGLTITGTISLNDHAPYPGGAAVSLSNSNSSVATVPATVTVPGGSSSVTFNIPTSVVTASTPTTISASYAGFTVMAVLTVIPSGSTTLTNFPMLFSLPADANLAAGAQSNGNDILFTATDGVTKLNLEIESYGTSTGQLNAWVQIPMLAPATDTVIYVYYGNASATNQQNATAVWSGNYKIVNHFKETSGNLSDASGNNNAGVPSGGATSTSAGQIGNGYSFDGSSGLVTINNNASWATTTTDMTLEFWFKPNSAPGNYLNMMSMGNWIANTYLYEMANGTVSAQIAQLSNPWAAVACSTAALPFLTTPDGKYHHFAMAYTGIYTTYGFFGLYVDGVLACSNPYTTGGAILGDGSRNICLGGACDSLRTNGSMDEFKLSVGTMRSSDWILTEVRNQNSPSTFFNVGPQQ
jgi:uncharacterized protein (TIGR03790 family)